MPPQPIGRKQGTQDPARPAKTKEWAPLHGPLFPQRLSSVLLQKVLELRDQSKIFSLRNRKKQHVEWKWESVQEKALSPFGMG